MGARIFLLFVPAIITSLRQVETIPITSLVLSHTTINCCGRCDEDQDTKKGDTVIVLLELKLRYFRRRGGLHGLLLGCLFDCLIVCLMACLPDSLIACLFACLLSCFLAFLLSCC